MIYKNYLKQCFVVIVFCVSMIRAYAQSETTSFNPNGSASGGSLDSSANTSGEASQASASGTSADVEEASGDMPASAYIATGADNVTPGSQMRKSLDPNLSTQGRMPTQTGAGGANYGTPLVPANAALPQMQGPPYGQLPPDVQKKLQYLMAQKAMAPPPSPAPAPQKPIAPPSQQTQATLTGDHPLPNASNTQNQPGADKQEAAASAAARDYLSAKESSLALTDEDTNITENLEEDTRDVATIEQPDAGIASQLSLVDNYTPVPQENMSQFSAQFCATTKITNCDALPLQIKKQNIATAIKAIYGSSQSQNIDFTLLYYPADLTPKNALQLLQQSPIENFKQNEIVHIQRKALPKLTRTSSLMTPLQWQGTLKNGQSVHVLFLKPHDLQGAYLFIFTGQKSKLIEQDPLYKKAYQTMDVASSQ